MDKLTVPDLVNSGFSFYALLYILCVLWFYIFVCFLSRVVYTYSFSVFFFKFPDDCHQVKTQLHVINITYFTTTRLRLTLGVRFFTM